MKRNVGTIDEIDTMKGVRVIDPRIKFLFKILFHLTIKY
jgi:hypothetical protein